MSKSSDDLLYPRRLSLLGDSQSVRMGKVWRHNLQGYKLETSCCVSGWTTSKLREAVQGGTADLEEVCFIFIGVNDVLKKVTYAEMIKNLKAILKHLKYHNKRILISTLPTLLNSSLYQEQQIRCFNVFIQSFSAQNFVTVVPFHKMFPPFVELRKKMYQLRYHNGRADNVHLSSTGLQSLIDLIVSSDERDDQ